MKRRLSGMQIFWCGLVPIILGALGAAELMDHQMIGNVTSIAAWVVLGVLTLSLFITALIKEDTDATRRAGGCDN